MGSGYVVHDNDGAAFWFTDLLAVMKTPVGDGARRDLAFADALAPVGSSPPMHIHHDEDEAWYLLEGRMRFRCGDDELLAEPGSFVFAPRGIPHSLLVEEGTRAGPGPHHSGRIRGVRAGGRAAGARARDPATGRAGRCRTD